jgi:thiamine biosynthesis lipoprotein
MPAPITILLATLLLGACDRANERLPEFELTGQTMGTTYSVKLVAADQQSISDDLAAALAERLAVIDSLMSTYDANSELSNFNATEATDWVPVSAELCAIIEQALSISERTRGAFDVTVGPLVNLWGFGPDGDVQEPPSDDVIAAAIHRVGSDKLHTDCAVPALRKDQADIYVDLSAVAKGYAVDQLAVLLEADQWSNFLVEIGGELRMRGHNADSELWAIAVERPADDSREIQSVVRVTDAAMATSGDYRNFFEYDGQRYSHTIDPRSGRPITHNVAAVTVVGDSAADADALATALLVLGPEDGLALAAREKIAAYFLLRTDAGIEQRMTGSFAALVNL